MSGDAARPDPLAPAILYTIAAERAGVVRAAESAVAALDQRLARDHVSAVDRAHIATVVRNLAEQIAIGLHGPELAADDQRTLRSVLAPMVARMRGDG